MSDPYMTTLDAIPFEEGLSPDEGWFDMRVQFFINSSRGDASEIVFGRAQFPPGAAHEWHRHPNAEEFCLMTVGGGTALLGDREVDVAAGDIFFSPKNEWHGFRNTSDTDTAEMIWGWCGAADKAHAGYEVARPRIRGERSPRRD